MRVDGYLFRLIMFELFTIVVLGCAKETVAPPVFPGVYVVGFVTQKTNSIGTPCYFTYWKDASIATQLSTGALGFKNDQPTSIVVDNGNVYISGYQSDNGVTTAKYWKDGHEFFLTHAAQGSVANAIAVSNGDVYVAGSVEKNFHQVAAYWKNGSVVYLSDSAGQAGANAIHISANGDIYVAGYVTKENPNPPNDSYQVATYWKNGVEQSLSDYHYNAQVYSMALLDTTVIAAGYTLT
ncbi:MAG TPA: hypothetical protein VJ508_19165, partial [Saprospiraceae bacterium]|nr:hypothetical protein [Saprospiraceae bacterium]